MNMRVSFFLLFTIAVFASGCFKNREAEVCVYDPCEYKAPQTEIDAVKAYLDTAQITGTTQHCSGLFYKIESMGIGATPDVCTSSIVARYTGRLTNGQVFDSGQFREPVPLGGGLITGWANGLPLIKEGGRITLYIPPALGYGSQPQIDQNTGRVIIPANSITIFNVELVKVY